MATTILNASSISKVKCIRQLQDHATLAESIETQLTQFAPLSSVLGDFLKLVRRAQEIVVREIEELACTLEKANKIAEALLVSKLLAEDSESSFFASKPDSNTTLLRAHINRLDKIGDVATAETLQKALVANLAGKDVPSNLVANEI